MMITRGTHPLAAVETISPRPSAAVQHSRRRAVPEEHEEERPSSPSTAYSEAIEEDDGMEVVDAEDQSGEEEVSSSEGGSAPVSVEESSDPLLIVGGPTTEDEEGDENEDDDEDDGGDEDDDEDMDDEYDDEERASVAYEMAQLEQSVPELRTHYKLVDRLGEGTFSSVYRALDMLHHSYNNTLWTTPFAIMPRGEDGLHIPSLAPETPQLVQLRAQHECGRVYVALKRIYVTSSPERIQNELDILLDLRGCTNIAYLIAAMRHEDQVIAVMPYNRHQDFRDYYRKAGFPLFRSYFASLFRALACTHEQQIIHRDVKPANFLYDTLSGTGILCDYGLAEKIGQGHAWDVWKSECCHSFPGPSWGGIKGRIKANKRIDKLEEGQCPGLAAGVHGARLPRPVPLVNQLKAMKVEWKELRARLKSDSRQKDFDYVERLKPVYPVREVLDVLESRAAEMAGWYKSWRPAGSQRASLASNGGRVGYLEEDRRPHVRANRAGTRGFRAPEVLFKCPDQTVALDIWSAGIILLCFLTKRFPFFNSNDDTEALAEITAIFGRRKMEKCAAMHNRTFVSNVPTFDTPSHSNFRSLVVTLNPALPYLYPASEIDDVVDLLERCLELDLTRRGTAEELLEHRFFDGMYDLGGGVLGRRGVLHLPVSKWEGGIRVYSQV